MKETNLNIRAGQTGKITFTEITGYTQEPELRGGVNVNGTCVDMQLQPDGRTLVIPPLPEGVWIYEVRADGGTALWGRLRVMESPSQKEARLRRHSLRRRAFRHGTRSTHRLARQAPKKLKDKKRVIQFCENVTKTHYTLIKSV